MDRAMKLVVLGRDGVLNRYRDEHVATPQEWEPVPGALEAVARLNHAGWHVVVATNQPGLGSGLLDMAGLNAVHRHMNELLARHGARIDAVFICPHTAADGCDCRKPAPGLLRQAAADHGLDLARSWMIGDILDDIEAGRRAGCRTILLDVGNETVWRPGLLREPHLRAGDLLEAARRLLASATPSRAQA